MAREPGRAILRFERVSPCTIALSRPMGTGQQATNRRIASRVIGRTVSAAEGPWALVSRFPSSCWRMRHILCPGGYELGWQGKTLRP